MPIPAALIPLLVRALPTVIGAVRQILSRNPDATDEQIFAELSDRLNRIQSTGEDWLESHPKAEPSSQ